MKKNKDDKVKMKEQNDKEHKPFIKSIKFQFIICSICAIILVFSLDFNPPKQSIPLFFYGSHVFILLASLILYLDLIYIKNIDIIKIWKMFVFFVASIVMVMLLMYVAAIGIYGGIFSNGWKLIYTIDHLIQVITCYSFAFYFTEEKFLKKITNIIIGTCNYIFK